MFYKINYKKIFKPIGIPNEIIKYINELDETTLKTLILIFSENRIFSKFEISKKLDKPILKINEALKILESKKIISLSIKSEEIPAYGIFEPSASQVTTNELVNCIQNNSSIQMLYNEAEKIYARPLNHIEKKELIYITQAFNLPVDVILMAINFCVENEKKSIKLLEKICENWSNSGISTHEQAEAQIKILTEQKQIENKIKKCFGIYGRSLSVNEKNYIFKWTKTYKFSLTMIKEAFERCVDATGKLSFQYIEKIINNWNENNIRTKQNLKELEEKHINLKKSKKSNKNYWKFHDPKAIAYGIEQSTKRSESLIKEELKRMGITIPNSNF